jgi:hypothetical protein
MSWENLVPLSGRRRCEEEKAAGIIEADEITVEVVDKHTGQTFRRTLPVSYCENANGVLLKGETSAGEPVEMSFLSEAALARLGELFGRGPDKPRCNGHDGKQA